MGGSFSPYQPSFLGSYPASQRPGASLAPALEAAQNGGTFPTEPSREGSVKLWLQTFLASSRHLGLASALKVSEVNPIPSHSALPGFSFQKYSIP